MKPQLSIIITSYKNPNLLRLCIKSLKKNVKDVEYEIIVCDGNTEEQTYDLMREEFPKIKFVPSSRNGGFAFLVNQGLDVAEGNYFFVINADIIIKNNSVKELLDFLKNNSDVGMVGPKLINFDNSVQPSCFRFYTLSLILYRRTFLRRFSFAEKKLNSFLMEDFNKTKILEADWIMGSAMMISKESLKKVGKVDKRFFMYFDDVDWCWRFWENNLKIVHYPLAEVYHYHGKQSTSQGVVGAVLLNKYTRIHIASAFKFFSKHFGKKNPHKVYNLMKDNKK